MNDQVSGALDRALAVLATMLLGWLVKRGYLGEGDAAALIPALVLLPSVLWGLWVNRRTALLQSASNVVGDDGKKTVILTSPELAAATPSTNIISNTATGAAITAAGAAKPA